MSAADRLAEIQARADAATDGPWDSYSHPGDRKDAPYSAVEVGEHEVRLSWLEGSALDASFIAKARTDVPALVAALRAVLNLHGGIDGLHTLTGRKIQLCAECERDGDWKVWPCPTVRAVEAALGTAS